MRGEDLQAELVNEDPYVAMYTAPNPGPKTLSGTHTYVVGRDPAVIIDPGPISPEYQRRIASSLERPGISVRAILLSHGHPDHAPGARVLKDLLGVEVVASPHISQDASAVSGVDRCFEGEEVFDLGSDMLHALATPGHAPDQMAFWMPGGRVLFSGDTVLGSGSTLIAPPEGDMGSYMATLERLRALEPRLIMPGHGPVITDPAAKMNEYIGHRKQRETQLLDTLAGGPGTLAELVARVYADTDPLLHELACGSLSAQLEKLEREGKVERMGERYRLRAA